MYPLWFPEIQSDSGHIRSASQYSSQELHLARIVQCGREVFRSQTQTMNISSGFVSDGMRSGQNARI